MRMNQLAPQVGQVSATAEAGSVPDSPATRSDSEPHTWLAPLSANPLRMFASPQRGVAEACLDQFPQYYRSRQTMQAHLPPENIMLPGPW